MYQIENPRVVLPATRFSELRILVQLRVGNDSDIQGTLLHLWESVLMIY